MRIDLLTLFPAMFSGFFSESILKRAQDKHLLEIHLHDIRDYTTDKHRRVDDYPYSGEAGMLMKIERLQQERTYDEVIFLTPDGERLHQSMANQLSMLKNVILLCGHYKGIDERIRELFITREISIGDYVLSGGELPAAVLVDAMARLIPGVLNDESSALSDSYQYELLSPPVYTRPYDYKGHKVPDILLSGNEKEIKEWKLQKAIEKTRKKRPDLLQNYDAES
jgi:tRNA (guanine37-N1)-methyltransferase